MQWSKRKPYQTSLMVGYKNGRQEDLHHKISALLEFSAEDDLTAFKDAVEKEGHDVDEVGLWYGRRIGSKEFGFEERTPLMIAAMFGSKNVLSYILDMGRVDVNRACGSDGATALHCAVAGGSAASLEVIKLLLDASANVSTFDANGNRLCDLIVSMPNDVFNSRKRILQRMLEDANGIGEACAEFEEAVGLMEKQQRKNIDTLQVSKDSKDGTKKKVYPVDLSMPDIKNGIFSTDEFRMYTFKVMPCSRVYSHDWVECPFAHPGENARRRDPRKFQYSCVPCPEFSKGSCSKGDACEYAHGIFECWLHPAQYRTRFCKDDRDCKRRVCFFAHTLEELRQVNASTGSAMPSPGSYSTSTSPALRSPASTPPLTPSGGSPWSRTMWHPRSHVAVPTLQLSQSIWESARNARDLELDADLLRLENHKLSIEQLMMEDIPSSSPSFRDRPRELNRLEDIFMSQNVNQPLGGYPSNRSTSRVIGSPLYRVDPSRQAAIVALNSRNAGFSNQSQIEHDMVNRRGSEFRSLATTIDKVDWSIPGDELNKPKNSSSFGF